MIELPKLQAIKHIVTHDNCSDGIASAMLLRQVLPNAKVTFCQYETTLHKTMEVEEGMVFCDFSPHITRVNDFLAAGAIVLDHHGGPAKEVTLAFAEKGLGAFADEKADPGVSGAMLAFREVWKPLAGSLSPGFYDDNQMAAFELAELAGVRDTWQKDSALWREACASAESLRFWPWDHVERHNNPDGWKRLLEIGPILIDRNEKKLENILKGSYQHVSSKGRRVTIFEGLKPTSDAAERLGDTNDLTTGLAFFTEKNAEGQTQMVMVFSNRSRGNFNCRNYALAHGGGGHIKAAGFSRLLQPNDKQPFQLAIELLHRYERVEDEWAALTSAPDFDKRVKNGEIVPKDLYESLHH
jgi:hypothetical protein